MKHDSECIFRVSPIAALSMNKETRQVFYTFVAIKKEQPSGYSLFKKSGGNSRLFIAEMKARFTLLYDNTYMYHKI